MGEQRQRYNEEFKKQTVKFIQEQTKTLGDLAEELNIPKVRYTNGWASIVSSKRACS